MLSADRPLTESEVKFLQYVRQWGKKVVFVVNKVRSGLGGGWGGCAVVQRSGVGSGRQPCLLLCSLRLPLLCSLAS